MNPSTITDARAEKALSQNKVYTHYSNAISDAMIDLPVTRQNNPDYFMMSDQRYAQIEKQIEQGQFAGMPRPATMLKEIMDEQHKLSPLSAQQQQQVGEVMRRLDVPELARTLPSMDRLVEGIVKNQLTLSPVQQGSQRQTPTEPVKQTVAQNEAKLRDDYRQYVQSSNEQNTTIRSANAIVNSAANQLQKNPTPEGIKQVLTQHPGLPDGLKANLSGLLDKTTAHQDLTTWAQEQRQALTKQSGQWFGLSAEARDAKQMLAVLDNKADKDVGQRVKERHPEFCKKVSEFNQKPPEIKVDKHMHQTRENPVLSMDNFKQIRQMLNPSQNLSEKASQQQKTRITP